MFEKQSKIFVEIFFSLFLSFSFYHFFYICHGFKAFPHDFVSHNTLWALANGLFHIFCIPLGKLLHAVLTISLCMPYHLRDFDLSLDWFSSWWSLFGVIFEKKFYFSGKKKGTMDFLFLFLRWRNMVIYHIDFWLLWFS